MPNLAAPSEYNMNNAASVAAALSCVLITVIEDGRVAWRYHGMTTCGVRTRSAMQATAASLPYLLRRLLLTTPGIPAIPHHCRNRNSYHHQYYKLVFHVTHSSWYCRRSLLTEEHTQRKWRLSGNHQPTTTAGERIALVDRNSSHGLIAYLLTLTSAS